MELVTPVIRMCSFSALRGLVLIIIYSDNAIYDFSRKAVENGKKKCLRKTTLYLHISKASISSASSTPWTTSVRISLLPSKFRWLNWLCITENVSIKILIICCARLTNTNLYLAEAWYWRREESRRCLWSCGLLQRRCREPQEKVKVHLTVLHGLRRPASCWGHPYPWYQGYGRIAQAGSCQTVSAAITLVYLECL